MTNPGWHMIDAPALERLAPYTWDWHLEHKQFVYVKGINAVGEADCQTSGVTEARLPLACLIPVTDAVLKGFEE